MALNNSQYDMILRSYEEKQLHSHMALEKRRQTIYEQLPELTDLQDEIALLGVTQARKLLSGDENALAEHKKELQKLIDEKRRLLTSAGYPEDYLEPTYECPVCKDTGYIGNQKCHCFQQAMIDLLYAQSNLKHILAEENFDTFSFDYYSDNHVDKVTGRTSYGLITEAYLTAKQFVETFQKDFRNLFFYGDTGVGKTFLTNCIAKELIDQSFSVIYFTSYELFDTLARGKFEKDNTSEMITEQILNCDLLIIDDLGAELTNSFSASQLFLCLNERLLHRKSTIISTNLSLESVVDLYSERTFSRITGNFTLLRLTGDDIRIKKKLMNREDVSCSTAQREH